MCVCRERETERVSDSHVAHRNESGYPNLSQSTTECAPHSFGPDEPSPVDPTLTEEPTSPRLCSCAVIFMTPQSIHPNVKSINT